MKERNDVDVSSQRKEIEGQYDINVNLLKQTPLCTVISLND